MIRAPRGLITISVTSVITLALISALAAQQPYTLVTLDIESGQGHGINNQRQIVGEYVNESGFTSPFLWQGGTLIPLGVLPDGQFGAAYDINDRGQIVGTGNSGDEGRAILWDNGRVINLGTLPGGDFSEARGINNRGDIAGMSSDSTLFFRPVKWVNGEAIDLGTVDGYPAGWGMDINDRGDVAGYLIPLEGLETRAALWTDGSVVNLGVLPGDTFSQAFGINNRGQVVGVSGNQPAGTARAFIWENGVMRELSPPDGYAFSHAYDISNSGRVTGTFGNTSPIAAVWDRGTVIPLPSVDTQAHLAFAINERGDVVGYTSAGPALWMQTP